MYAKNTLVSSVSAVCEFYHYATEPFSRLISALKIKTDKFQSGDKCQNKLKRDFRYTNNTVVNTHQTYVHIRGIEP